MKIKNIYGAIINSIRKKTYILKTNGKINFGKDVIISQGFHYSLADNAVINIGDNTFFNRNCSLNARASIQIGNDCLFGENVMIYDHNHKFRISNIPIREQGFSSDPVIIGDNCWFGSNVVILKGVHIGDHCVIGAGTVVCNSVPDNTICDNRQNIYKEMEIK